MEETDLKYWIFQDVKESSNQKDTQFEKVNVHLQHAPTFLFLVGATELKQCSSKTSEFINSQGYTAIVYDNPLEKPGKVSAVLQCGKHYWLSWIYELRLYLFVIYDLPG